MTNPTDSQTLEILCENNIGLRAVFVRQNDRWSHALEILAGNEWRRALESVEGSGANDWPVSPPLQHLHFEDRPGGLRVALAVGMAGRSHWSASIEADPATAEIRYDIACRVHAKPEFLGATYHTLAPFAAAQTGHEICLGGPHASPLFVRPNSAQFRLLTPQSFAIVPATMPAKFPATARWQYSIRIVPIA